MVFDILKALLSFLGLAQEQSETNRKYRLDDAIEEHLVNLLSSSKYKRRTFKTILRKIGGYDGEPDELRRHLVRIGAIRSGTPGDGEFWELLAENRKTSTFQTFRYRWMWLSGSTIFLLVFIGGIWWSQRGGNTCPQTCDQSGMTLEEYRECRRCKGLPD